jgi:hypothetical protein
MALKRGDSSLEVEQLNRELEILGYSVGRINYEFDALTEEIVKAFQQEAGLVVDGVVGPSTRSALSQAVSKAKSIPKPASSPPQVISNGDYTQSNWQQWRVIAPNSVNGRGGPGFEYPVEFSFANNRIISPHPDYSHSLQFDRVGKPWIVMNERGAPFFVRANNQYIEPAF